MRLWIHVRVCVCVQSTLWRWWRWLKEQTYSSANKVASPICHQNRRINVIKIASYSGSQSEEIEIRNKCTECNEKREEEKNRRSLRTSMEIQTNLEWGKAKRISIKLHRLNAASAASSLNTNKEMCQSAYGWCICACVLLLWLLMVVLLLAAEWRRYFRSNDVTARRCHA